MTRKHFQKFAEMIKTADLDERQKTALANKMIAVFLEDNPRFDSVRFLKACGIN